MLGNDAGQASTHHGAGSPGCDLLRVHAALIVSVIAALLGFVATTARRRTVAPVGIEQAQLVREAAEPDLVGEAA